MAGRYTFTTFEEYVEERWDFSQEQARRLIEAASAAEKLHQLVDIIPARESHVRELLKIADDGDRAKVSETLAHHTCA